MSLKKQKISLDLGHPFGPIPWGPLHIQDGALPDPLSLTEPKEPGSPPNFWALQAIKSESAKPPNFGTPRVHRLGALRAPLGAGPLYFVQG